MASADVPDELKLTADYPTTASGREALEECIKYIRFQIIRYQDMERKLMEMRAAAGRIGDDGREEDTDARS